MIATLHVLITDTVEQLRELASAIRRRDLQMVHGAKLGHVGGELSATDILVTLYFGVLRVDPEQPNDPDRDRFILSKGHTAVALYTTLAHRGFLPVDATRDVRPTAVQAERPSRPHQGAGRRNQHRPAGARPARRGWRGHRRQDCKTPPGASLPLPATANCRKAATGKRRCRQRTTSSTT